mmetsp:Transcript_8617/g.23847  ORF Transcript_8617/g.23847 Transcript_8617/m.23847 type:complete len:86 (+) Transcript_8617:1028-1285(+)
MGSGLGDDQLFLLLLYTRQPVIGSFSTWICSGTQVVKQINFFALLIAPKLSTRQQHGSAINNFRDWSSWRILWTRACQKLIKTTS